MDDVKVKKAVVKKSSRTQIPRVQTGLLLPGKSVTIGTGEKDAEVLEVVCPEGKTLEYTVLLTVRERDIPTETKPVQEKKVSTKK